MTMLGGRQADHGIEGQHQSRIPAQAGGAIPVGSTVVFSTATLTPPNLVGVVGAANQDYLFVGIYDGVGGTGAADATYGGRAAVSGDAIELICKGPVYARVNGTDNVAVGDQLALDATGSLIKASAVSADGLKAQILGAEVRTADSIGRALVWLK